MSPTSLNGHDLGVLEMLSGSPPQSCVSVLRSPKHIHCKVHSLFSSLHSLIFQIRVLYYVYTDDLQRKFSLALSGFFIKNSHH